MYIYICLRKYMYITYICIYVYIYVYRHALQGLVRPCSKQGTSRAQSKPASAGGSWALPRTLPWESQIRLAMEAP